MLQLRLPHIKGVQKNPRGPPAGARAYPPQGKGGVGATRAIYKRAVEMLV